MESMITLPIAGWLAALILVSIIAIAYYVGRKSGFTEGVQGMAETLVHLEILTRQDLDKLVHLQEEWEEEDK